MTEKVNIVCKRRNRCHGSVGFFLSFLVDLIGFLIINDAVKPRLYSTATEHVGFHYNEDLIGF